RPALARVVRELLAALRFEPRDLVELLVPLALEAELHDVALTLRADVRLDRREVQVVAFRLRNRVLRARWEELEEVVERPGWVPGARAAVRRRRVTADHGLVLGHGEHLPALRHLAFEPRRVEQLLTRVLWALLELVLRVEEVEGGRRAARLHVLLHLVQQLVEARGRGHRPALAGGARDVVLEVEELELRGRP